MKTHDICIGAGPRAQAAQVLLTSTDKDVANKTVAFLEENKEHFMDMKGLRFFVRESNRSGDDAPAAEVSAVLETSDDVILKPE